MHYINPVALQLGPLQIRWYAIAIVTGIAIAVAMAVFEARRVGLEDDDIYDFVLWAVPLSFIGSRLYYVAFEWSYYKEHLDQIFAIWNGGIAIYGGLIAGGIFLYFFCKKRNLSLLQYLDIAAPAVIIAQGIGRWGNFFNHEAFGAIISKTQLESMHLPTWLINNMNINGHYRTPTFLYESMWDILGGLGIIIYRHFRKSLHKGELFALYLIWYAFGRFFIEGMRTDSLYIANTSLRVSQCLSMVLFIVGVLLFIVVYRNKKNVYTRNHNGIK